MLADRGTMRAARVGENDVVLHQFRQILQVIDPSARRLNPPQRLGITQELGQAGINIEDFELHHISREYGGVLVLVIAGADDALLARRLLQEADYSTA